MTNAMTNMSPASVPASFALTLLDDIKAIGKSPDRLISSLGLPFSYKDLCKSNTQLIQKSQFIQLFQRCITVLYLHANPECKHLPMRTEELQMLCYCIINCEHLEQVINRTASFNKMLGKRVARLSLTHSKGDAIFRMDAPSNSGLLASMAGLSLFHRLFSWLIGEPIPLYAYGVTYADHPDRASLMRLFHYPILYAQPYNHFRFPAEYLGKIVVRNYQQLIKHLDTLQLDIMLDPAAESFFAEAIEQMITASFSKGDLVPTLKQLAGYFEMSRATFCRRLADNGITFRDLKERCRRNAAIKLLTQDSRITITDIAMQLGYHDTRAFRRAFRAWTGQSPSDYRRLSI